MTAQPNFLFFITDQHRADWLGCMGHPVVKTPNIDAIAEIGTKFTDFHVASPVCMPNRGALMTGRMPSVNRLRYNGCPLPAATNTFVDVLSKSGYRTASIGKSHLQPFTDDAPYRPPQPKGQVIAEAWKSDGADYGKESPARYKSDEFYDFPKPYYGFEHVDMVTGHGDRCGGHYQQWLRQNCSDWQFLTNPKNELPHEYSCPQAYRTPIPEEFYPTTWIGDRAVDFLNSMSNHDVPFFSFVSFPDPHHPFNPPGRYWDMYSPKQFDLLSQFDQNNSLIPPLEYLSDRLAKGLSGESKQSAFRASETHLKEAMALTAGMISMIDDQIGRVIAALKANGQFENTVIIFTADHGDYLGDFGMLLKGPMPFRSITRVPMIWSDPRLRTQQTSDALASTIDVSATILDRVGAAPYNGLQGKSFLHCLKENASHRDKLLIESNDPMPRCGFEAPARVRTLLTKKFRLSCYQGQDWGELYDLLADPEERKNLWNTREYANLKSDLAFQLIDQLIDQMDKSPLTERLA